MLLAAPAAMSRQSICLTTSSYRGLFTQSTGNQIVSIPFQRGLNRACMTRHFQESEKVPPLFSVNTTQSLSPKSLPRHIKVDPSLTRRASRFPMVCIGYGGTSPLFEKSIGFVSVPELFVIISTMRRGQSQEQQWQIHGKGQDSSSIRSRALLCPDMHLA